MSIDSNGGATCDPRLQRHPFGFYQVQEMPSASELRDYYAEKYYQEATGSYELEYQEEELAYIRYLVQLRHRAAKAASTGLPEPGKLLDVGCGEGFVLEHFASCGWQATGIDFSSDGMRRNNPQRLDSLRTGDVFDLLTSEIESSRTYDVVWLQNVLEHVVDPVDLMTSLRRLVSPHGVAVVTAPNDCSDLQLEALRRGYIDRAFWVAPPDHLSYFGPASLRRIGMETGWHCADMLGDFPIDWYLFHSGSNYIRRGDAGKEAHHARVNIMNLLSRQTDESVLALLRGFSGAGAGRDLTAFFVPA